MSESDIVEGIIFNSISNPSRITNQKKLWQLSKYRYIVSMKSQNTNDIRHLAKIMKALSHEHRLKIYIDLWHEEQRQYDGKNECLIYDLCDTLGIGVPTISHHLKELEHAWLIILKKRGRELTAQINHETKAQICQYFACNSLL